MTAALRRSFASLHIANYRRYFAGQLVSVSGNWMQIVAEAWLVVSLTGSGIAVGITSALQFLPILLFASLGGLLADRLPKRRLLTATQALMALPALGLFAITVSGEVQIWMVFALVFVRGCVNAVDNPARQSFVVEMVGSDRLVSAIGLNSVLIHAARVVGPALAGLIIALWGVEPCFLINALSFAAMIVALQLMEPAKLQPAPQARREPGAVRAALRYVRATPELAIPLALMALVGTLSFNFLVTLPLLARFTFDGGPEAYAILASAMGLGSMVGALATGSRRRVDPALFCGAAVAFGVLALLAAAAPNVAVAAGLLALVGVASVSFAASVNTWLQLRVEPQMRGRVMALYSIVFLGSTPIGGPIAGWLAEAVDPRATLVMAGAAALAAGLLGRVAFARAGIGPRAAATALRPPAISSA